MTLELKSGPVPKTTDPNYLSTIPTGRCNPEEVLAQFGSDPVILVIIESLPRGAHTGRLEERGAWIHQAWVASLAQMPDLQGCRLGWDTVFFVTDSRTFKEVKKQFQQILQDLRRPELENRCILSEADGTWQKKGRDFLNEMQHDLTAGGVGFKSRFAHQLRDGAAWQGT